MIFIFKIHYVIIFLLVLLIVPEQLLSQNFFVSTEGSDSNPGSKTKPFATFLKARDAIREIKRQNGGKLSDSATVWIRGGTYYQTSNFVLGYEDGGEKNKPVCYRAYKDGEVVEKVKILGGLPYSISEAKLVTDSMYLKRFHPEGRGKIWEIRNIPAEIISIIEKNHPSDSKINLFGKPYKIAAWPNLGFVHIDKGKEINRGIAWHSTVRDGPKPDWSIESPIGAEFESIEPLSPLLETEFLRTKKMSVYGFLGADWLKEIRTIASISGQRIKLADYSTYGINVGAAVPRRFKILNALCELDRPGEYFFDEESKSLFLYPHDTINDDVQLIIGQTDKIFHLNGASHVVIRDVTFVNGRNAVYIEGGNNNVVAGCTFKFNARYGVTITPKHTISYNNGVVACDFVDNLNAVNLNGGYINGDTIVAANNYLLNSHIYQKELSEAGSRCIRLQGAGNRVAYNLIHNISGQAIVWGGNDHLIEYNEIYNVQATEGDGGAIYTGADWGSWGNVIRYNFLHHLMCVPQLHPKGGIYLDDRDFGDEVYGNVLYKGAHRAILINGGAGQKANGNLFIEGYWGIYNHNYDSENLYQMSFLYENGTLSRGDKMDYIYRLENRIGKEGWNNSYWTKKYPLMGQIINQRKERYWPIECKVEDNCFYNNKKDTWFGGTETTMDQVPQYILFQNNGTLPSLDVFEKPSVLNFKFKAGESCSGTGIPFEKIGLYKDEFRKDVPDKNVYRKKVKDHFDGIPSYDPDATYDIETINDLVYYGFDELTLPKIHKYDFGTANSPVQSNWKRISPQSSGEKYWSETSVDAFYREDSEYSKISCDYISGIDPSSLNIKVQNGKWEIKLGLMNAPFSIDRMSIKAEGQIISNLIACNQGESTEIRAYAIVEDEVLNLQFSDHGGLTERWLASYLILDMVEESKDSILHTRPLAYWDFNENSGKVAKDLIGGADAVWQNGNGINLSWPSGIEGNAASLKGGEKDKFIIASDPLEDSEEISISVWVRLNETGGYKGIITTRNNPVSDNSNNWGLSVENEPANFDARFNGKGLDSSKDIFTHVWHHVLLTWDNSGKQQLFLDGKLSSASNSDVTRFITGGRWWIGDDPCCSSREINAQIDELAMFDKVLTPDEILLIYINGLNGHKLDALYKDQTTSFENKHDKKKEIDVYPNPAVDKLYVEWDHSHLNVENIQIFNALGSMVFNTTHDVQKQKYLRVNLSKLTPGIYCIVLKGDDKRFYSKKFLIRN